MRSSRIYITGFMGSGKSCVAPLVAKELGVDSIDLDRDIADAEGMSIPAIFDVLGEEAFRSAEREALRATAQRVHAVVSLGGGTIVDPENLAFCREHGVLVCLEAPLDVLCRRLARRGASRPKLWDEEGHMLRGPALEARVRDLLAARAPFYQQAHVRVKTGDRAARDVAKDVVSAVRAWERRAAGHGHGSRA